jgi:hypothetical protein
MSEAGKPTIEMVGDLAGTGTFQLVAAGIGWQANWVPNPPDEDDCEVHWPNCGAWNTDYEVAIKMLWESVGEWVKWDDPMDDPLGDHHGRNE